jgi:predicted RNase H-like HicB family nuclease
VTYFALIHRSEAGAFGVSFPDLPGCVALGDSFEEAANEARIALRLHLAGLHEDGEVIPAPRSFEELERDPAFLEDRSDALALVQIAPQLRTGQVKRVNITLDEGVLEAIDWQAKRLGLTRSAFIARSATEAVSD